MAVRDIVLTPICPGDPETFSHYVALPANMTVIAGTMALKTDPYNDYATAGVATKSVTTTDNPGTGQVVSTGEAGPGQVYSCLLRFDWTTADTLPLVAGKTYAYYVTATPTGGVPTVVETGSWQMLYGGPK